MVRINKLDENTIEVDGIKIELYNMELSPLQRTLFTSEQIKALTTFLNAIKRLKIKSTYY